LCSEFVGVYRDDADGEFFTGQVDAGQFNAFDLGLPEGPLQVGPLTLLVALVIGGLDTLPGARWTRNTHPRNKTPRSTFPPWPPPG
jgi:hypothetical protein